MGTLILREFRTLRHLPALLAFGIGAEACGGNAPEPAMAQQQTCIAQFDPEQPVPTAGAASEQFILAKRLFDAERWPQAAEALSHVAGGEAGDDAGNVESAQYFLAVALFKVQQQERSRTLFTLIVDDPHHAKRRKAGSWLCGKLDGRKAALTDADRQLFPSAESLATGGTTPARAGPKPNVTSRPSGADVAQLSDQAAGLRKRIELDRAALKSGVLDALPGRNGSIMEGQLDAADDLLSQMQAAVQRGDVGAADAVLKEATTNVDSADGIRTAAEQAGGKPSTVASGDTASTGPGGDAPACEDEASCKTACAAGDQRGCFRLGDLYATGRGAQKDTALAARIFKKACDARNAEACNALGYLYGRGFGVSKDPKLSWELFQKACDLGHDIGHCENARGASCVARIETAKQRRPKLDSYCGPGRNAFEALETVNSEQESGYAGAVAAGDGCESAMQAVHCRPANIASQHVAVYCCPQ